VGGCAPIDGPWLPFEGFELSLVAKVCRGGGGLICGWVYHGSWTLVVVLGSWLIVVGAGWSFVSGWAIVHEQHFLFKGYGPSLVVCWWLACLWLGGPAFKGSDCCP
jgi:hypothetical protein